MAGNNLAIKILGDIVKGQLRCGVRCFHGGRQDEKRNLHNTESVVSLVADSMGRTRGKLTGAEWERNGMTRVGPSSDILTTQVHTVAAAPATVESLTQEAKEFVMSDPNSSMWNLCKNDQNQASKTKKMLATKFKRMKEHIKEYYLDRLEENKTLFAEVETPLTIPKLEKRPNMRMRDDDRRGGDRMNEEIIVVKERPLRRSQRMKEQFAQMQPLPQENLECNVNQRAMDQETMGTSEEMTNYAQDNQMHHRSFNQSPLSRVADGDGSSFKMSMPSQQIDDSGNYMNGYSQNVKSMKGARGNKMVQYDRNTLPDIEEGMKSENIYVDEKEAANKAIQSFWKRGTETKTEKDVKIMNRGGGSFEEGMEAISPAVHFKTWPGPQPAQRRFGLMGKITSEDTLTRPFQKNLVDTRDFSTLVRNSGMYNLRRPKSAVNITAAYDKYKPINLALQREIASQCENLRNVNGNSLIRAHSMAMMSNRLFSSERDPCVPQRLPPIPELDCSQPIEKLVKCKKPEFEWPPCPKINICGCDPPSERVDKSNCGREDLKALVSMSKRPEYDCPAFSECSRRTTLNTKKPGECCYRKKVCNDFVGKKKPFISALERQEISLGQKYWTEQKRCFHTNGRLCEGGGKSDDCPNNKGPLPCLKSVQIPGQRKKETKKKDCKACEKICMPCCEPARDPPECFAPFQKPPCTKHKNPRPSFSECKKKFPYKQTSCECDIPKKPVCQDKKKSERVC